MYGYCAFQSSEEFSALDTSRMAISFFAGSSSPAARTDAVANRTKRIGRFPVTGGVQRKRMSGKFVRSNKRARREP